MVAIRTSTQMHLATIEQERIGRMARLADHCTIECDSLTGGWVVRDPATPGYVEIVTPDGMCTCRQHRLWDRCPHSALVVMGRGADR